MPLSQKQRFEIVLARGRVSGPELAKRYGVEPYAIHAVWENARRKMHMTPVIQGKIKAPACFSRARSALAMARLDSMMAEFSAARAGRKR